MVVANASGVLSTQAIPTGTVSGSGTLNYVPKWTPDGSTLGNSQIFDNGTNVGIGTSSPSEKLHLSSAADIKLLVETTISGSGANSGLFLKTATEGYWGIQTGNAVSSGLRFYDLVANAERMRITASGNVGIGTSSPTAKLDVLNGTINLSNSYNLSGRNAANTLNIALIGRNSSDRVVIDPDGYGTNIGGGGTVLLNPSGGNVGIGTSSVTPIFGTTVKIFNAGSGGTLEVGGSTVNARFFGSEGLSLAGIGTNTSHPFTLFTGDVERIRIFANGRVGIGTGATDQGSTFQVAGSMYNTTGALFAASSGNVGIGGGPATKFHVYGNSTLAGATLIDPSAATSSYLYLRYGGANKSYYGSAAGFDAGSADEYVIGSVGNSPFSIYTNAARRITVTGDGNVGIGVTNPSAKLDVQDPSGATARVRTFTAGNAQLTIDSVGGAAILDLQTTAGLNRIIGGAGGTSNLSFVTASAERMRITSTGVVGIGTTTPQGLFEVSGAGVSYFTRGTKSILINPNQVGADTNALIDVSSGMAIAFASGTAERMRITSSGSVGIGTTIPSAKLQVVGDALFGGDATYNNVFVTNNSTTGGGAFTIQQNGVNRGQFAVSGGWLGDTSSDTAITSVAPNIRFYTNNSVNERMRIDGSGNVGIGTASPNQKLTVVGNINMPGGGYSLIYGTSDANTRITGDNTSGSSFLDFRTAGSTRLYITDAGEVLVNTTTDAGAYALQVSGSIYNTTGAVLATSSGGLSIGTTTTYNNYILNYAGASIAVLALQNASTGSSSTDGFQLSSSGNLAYIWNYENAAMLFGTNATERMRITSAGQVLINTTTATSPYIMTVAGAVYVNNTPTFSSSGNIATYLSNTITIPASSTFTNGSVWSPLSNNNFLTFGGSNTISENVTLTGMTSVNRVSFSAASSTITMTQGGTGVRALSAVTVLQQTTGTINGTVSHGATLLLAGVDALSSANVTYTNYYALAINPLDEYDAGSTFTNRWGIYQVGGSDRNYFGGKVLINTTTETGAHRLIVSGTALVTSITTGNPTSGTAQPWKLGSKVDSSMQLDTTKYIEVDINGTAYKLALVIPA